MQTFSSGKAVLFIVNPVRVHDHFKRPLLYDFQPRFIEKVIKSVDQGGPAMAGRSILTDIDAISSVKPSAEGELYRTSEFSDLHSFMLIIDQGAQESSLCPTRTILYGFFNDEPIADQFSMTPEKYLNHNAYMIVTQRVVINIGVGYNKKSIVMTDTTVAHDDPHILGSHDPIVQITPPSIASSIHTIDDESLVMVDNESLQNSSEFNLNTKFDIPTTHTKAILDGIFTSADLIESSKMYSDLGDLGDTEVFDGMQFASLSLDSIKQTAQMDKISNARSGALPDNYIQVSEIVGRYDVQVIPIEAAPNDVSIIPQDITNINNLFSSMLAAAIPPIMRRIGLSAIGFDYNSFEEAVQVSHIESLLDDTDQVLKRKWNMFFARFKAELHPILKSNGGEYDLSVFSNMAGTTNIILNFYDMEPLPSGYVYQEPTMVGGLVSPVLGSSDALYHNVEEVSLLIDSVKEYFD